MLRITQASALHEWERLREDPWDLAMISLVPMLTVLLLWWIFSAGLPGKLPIGLLDQDHSALSRQAARLLQASPGLDITRTLASEHDAEQALRGGEIEAYVQIPPDFARQVTTQRPTRVVLVHNAQRSMPSGSVQRDVRAAIGALSAGIELEARMRRGQSPAQAHAALAPLRLDATGLFNVSANYQVFLATTLMPALLHILAMTAGAWAMGRKLRDRSLDVWLRDAIGEPVGALPCWSALLAAILGKVIWPMLGMMAAASVAFTLMTTRLHAEPAAWVVTWTGLLLLVLLSVALGALAASLTLSLRMALSMTGFITAPAFAFSGVGYPILAMPPGAQLWAKALPLTHYLQLQVRMLEMQAPLTLAWWPLAGLAGGTLATLALSALALRRAQALPERWGAR